jgi:hypothetical protein
VRYWCLAPPAIFAIAISKIASCVYAQADRDWDPPT